jgi:hypothetical protein
MEKFMTNKVAFTSENLVTRRTFPLSIHEGMKNVYSRFSLTSGNAFIIVGELGKIKE